MKGFITPGELETFICLLMSEIRDETPRAKWNIKWKEIQAPAAALCDRTHCGPLAICAVETILSTEWSSQKENHQIQEHPCRRSVRTSKKETLLIQEHPRRKAVRALKYVVKRCYEKKWFNEQDIADAAEATKKLCGQDLKILERP